ncbi:MAG TPA: phosphotransferase family protein [Mycobacteriales bacterium]|nr:phosphotransferase family protein [Mycobacteriales bacterium]
MSARDEALARWLAPRLGTDRVTITDPSRSGSGNSNETLLFTAQTDTGARRLVARFQPQDDALFLRPDVAREARILEAVGHSGAVPVPTVVDIEADPTVLGTPFFVMDAVDGRVLVDMPTYHRAGWLVDLTAEARARHWDEGLVALTSIARLPTDELGFLADTDQSATDEPTALRALVAATRAWLDWAARGRDTGLLETAMTHLEQTCPDLDDAVLSWGDARPGNLIYAADGRVAAVLDWEMAALAPAEVDLGWWLMMEENYSVRARTPLLDGVPERDAVVARWEELMGRPARELRWFLILAGVRMGVVMLRSRDANVAAGVLPPDATTHTHNTITQMLAAWLDLPEPELSPHFRQLMRHFQQQKAAATSG